MEEVVLKHKGLDLYVVHGVDVPKVIVCVPEVSVGVPKCMNQRVKGQINVEDFEQENEDFKEEIPFELNEADSSNDELRKARNKVRKRNAEWYELAQTIKEKAI
ncbi:hypothetical protein RDABS01_034194 [Bienertia sinuspersici]